MSTSTEPASCNTPKLSDLQKHLFSVDVLNVLFEHVKSSQLCPGNPDHDFVHLVEEENDFWDIVVRWWQLLSLV